MSTKLVNLKDGSDIIIPKTILAIDSNNVLVNKFGTTPYTYTATQDCFADVAYGATDTINFKIDNNIFSSVTGNSASANIFVKQGQKLSIDGFSSGSYMIKIFGIKY